MPDERIRPNPDELLARVQAEEARQAHGRLKIFLGYAAGVGKTYAMLEAAHQRRDEDMDVVIGYVETHGRARRTRWSPASKSSRDARSATRAPRCLKWTWMLS